MGRTLGYPTPPGLLGAAWERFLYATAILVDDLEQRPLRGPETRRRRQVRTCAVVVAAIALSLLLIFSILVSQPSARTTRIYQPSALLKAQGLTFGSSAKESWLCPCLQSRQSYSQYLSFNLTQTPLDSGLAVPYDPQGQAYSTIHGPVMGTEAPFNEVCTSYQTRCGEKTGAIGGHVPLTIYSACSAMLQNFVLPEGSPTFFSFLEKPQAVWQASASTAQSNVFSSAYSYNILLEMSSVDLSGASSQLAGAWYCIEDMLDVLSSVWGLVANSEDTMPSAATFWEMAENLTANGMRYGDVFAFEPFNLTGTGSVMPVVTFNWDVFVDSCEAPYCDVTKQSTLAEKLFASLYQIGGIITILLIVLRLVVWPALAACLPDKSDNDQSVVDTEPINRV